MAKSGKITLFRSAGVCRSNIRVLFAPILHDAGDLRATVERVRRFLEVAQIFKVGAQDEEIGLIRICFTRDGNLEFLGGFVIFLAAKVNESEPAMSYSRFARLELSKLFVYKNVRLRHLTQHIERMLFVRFGLVELLIPIRLVGG